MATLAHYQAQAEAALRMKAMQAEVERWKSLAERLQAQADEMRSGRQWISVEDRLPELRAPVIVWCAGAECAGVAWISQGAWLMPEPQSLGYETITHWHPLPASPTTSGDGQHE